MKHLAYLLLIAAAGASVTGCTPVVRESLRTEDGYQRHRVYYGSMSNWTDDEGNRHYRANYWKAPGDTRVVRVDD